MNEPEPRPKLPRLREDSGITCKGCGEIHWFEGYGEGCNTPTRHPNHEFQVLCTSKKEWFTYDLSSDEIIERNFSPVAYASNEVLLARIKNIEDQLAKLELKTAELPERDGIKQLRNDIKTDYSAFLADMLSKLQSPSSKGGAPPYG